jgi:hypothetical protein
VVAFAEVGIQGFPLGQREHRRACGSFLLVEAALALPVLLLGHHSQIQVGLGEKSIVAVAAAVDDVGELGPNIEVAELGQSIVVGLELGLNIEVELVAELELHIVEKTEMERCIVELVGLGQNIEVELVVGLGQNIETDEIVVELEHCIGVELLELHIVGKMMMEHCIEVELEELEHCIVVGPVGLELHTDLGVAAAAAAAVDILVVEVQS